VATLAVTLVCAAGCPPADTYDTPVGDTDCGDCVSPGTLYKCTCSNNDPGPSRCMNDPGAAQTECSKWCRQNGGGQGGDATLWPCSLNRDSGTCSSWNPAGEVTFSNGTRFVDAAYIESVYYNPAPLWSCDDLHLTGQPGPAYGFKVNNASAGELLYVLGLRNGDIPLTINGMPLTNYADGQAAFNTLFLGGVTTYTLVVSRGGTTVNLHYQLT